MTTIRMVDLHTQYTKIKTEIDAAIQQVIDSTAFIKGSAVKEFEQHLAEYHEAGHAISCGNGTDALQIAMMALDLQPGDEVITTPFTFVATVEVIALLGLKPVFVDVEADSFNLNVNQIEAAITPRTKAIVPVHLYGQCANMEPLLRIAQKHHLPVIEDTAQAIGSEYIFADGTRKKAGTLGTIGCTSFFPSKNLGAFGDGGALFTDSEELAKRIRAIANHGSLRKYYHDMVGINSRLDSLQAAILNVKLNYLDEYKQARQQAAAAYDKALGEIGGIEIPQRLSYSTHVFHQYTLKMEETQRDDLQQFLKDKGIPSMVYYPVPMHLQGAHNQEYKEGDFPVAEKLCKTVLSLPMHTELTAGQINRITSEVAAFF